MNFDNPYWIDLKVTYEFYQTSGLLPEFHKKHVCTKCQYEIPCFTTCDDVRCKCPRSECRTHGMSRASMQRRQQSRTAPSSVL